MKVGLTLGKFSPLHRGHQLVLETALGEMDRVLALIYAAPESSVPLQVRAEWIRKLYPAVEVIEAPDGPTEVGYTSEITGMHDRYIRARMSGRGVTHFYSSEPYGEHVSRALGAVDRRVDPDRRQVPVSGTLILNSPYEYRRFVEPLVYRDLVIKAVLLGAPSTGKSTLAEALAARYATVWMPEYGREYWDAHQVGRRLSRGQLVEIAEEHRRREDALLMEANQILFVDTDATTTRLFSLYYHGECDERLERLADEAATRYDIAFLCGDDIPYSATEDRSGEANRALMQQWTREDLERRGIRALPLCGSIETRMDAAGEALEELRAERIPSNR